MSANNGKRKILVIEYDVTDLTAKQIDALMLEAVVQGEASDPYDDTDESGGHPDVAVITSKVIERAARSR
jgi:hypothetical protein